MTLLTNSPACKCYYVFPGSSNYHQCFTKAKGTKHCVSNPPFWLELGIPLYEVYTVTSKGVSNRIFFVGGGGGGHLSYVGEGMGARGGCPPPTQSMEAQSLESVLRATYYTKAVTH